MNDSLWAVLARAIVALSPMFFGCTELARNQNSGPHQRAREGRTGPRGPYRLDDAVVTSVREVEQVLVVSLKTASADGSLTEAERAEVKNVAITMVRRHLGAKGWHEGGSVLGLSNGELERMLAARVEGAVFDLRGHPGRVLSNMLRIAFNTGKAAPPHATNGSR